MDFKLDEKARSVVLTDLGVKRIEQKLGVNNLYEENFDTIHHVESALKAKTLYLRDKEYIVRDNQVIIVDEHTGRLMFGRRYSDGLHQSIEAKEGVPIQQESRTLATISLQNYFRLYHKLAGMTGTAETEASEFHDIYKLGVLVIPTNRPVARKDANDSVYKTKREKYGAVLKEIRDIHGQADARQGAGMSTGNRKWTAFRVRGRFVAVVFDAASEAGARARLDAVERLIDGD